MKNNRINKELLRNGRKGTPNYSSYENFFDYLPPLLLNKIFC